MKGTLQPLWPIYSKLVQLEPTPASALACWRGDEAGARLREAAVELGAHAERRVMLLKNPALPRPAATHTLVAGLQLLLPGEHAPVHRHTQAGIRFMLQGRARMQVGEETFDVEEGDLVVLPSMTAHGHTGIGEEPALWLDVLDVPTVGFLGATFSDEGGALPAAEARAGWRTPLDAARAGLSDTAHASLGRTTRYRSPNGDDVLPIIRATLHEVPAGMRGAAWRSTASTVWAVVSGQGTLRAGEETLSWGPRDVFVTPNWSPWALASPAGATLISLSDAAMLSKLGLYFEEPA